MTLELWGRVVAPCVTCRLSGEAPPAIPVWLPADWTDADLRWSIEAEDGSRFEGRLSCADLPALGREALQGRSVRSARLPLVSDLPPGQHDLSVTSAAGTDRATLIAAPDRAYLPAGIGGDTRTWGIATHLYQVRSKADIGVGGFGHLPALAQVAGREGAQFIGLNPLHALFPQWPDQASPYFPSSRKFLNPLYLDPTRIDGFEASAEARRKTAFGQASS